MRVAHPHGLKVTAHSYGTEGDWAAVRGGVDGIEHLVNVPHELPGDLIQAIKAKGIRVCPTFSGSAYSVWKFLQAPEQLYEDLAESTRSRHSYVTVSAGLKAHA